MKTYFFITAISLFIVFSCNNTAENNFKENIQNEQALSKEARQLIGKWLINSTESNGMMNTCNQCPYISFLTNNTAILTQPNGNTENLIWHLKENKLRIDYLLNNVKEKTFPDTLYQAVFSNDKAYSYLEIKQVDSGYSFTLTKHN